jgi:hypothetical protein
MTPASADLDRIAKRYRAFAIGEARGVSEVYETLALGIAASPEILDFIASMPADRRQPNLFLAAVRHVCGVPENTIHLRSLLRQEHERIRSVMLSRTTQTNEPARCSVLLPVLAQLPQPLALLERKKVEMLFAHLKRILRLNRLRLRGPSGAKDELLLAAIAQNLRKLAKIVEPRAASATSG